MCNVPAVCIGLYSFDVGGSELLGLRLIRHYQEHGIRVVCCATRREQGPLTASLSQLGVPFLALGLERRSRVGRVLAKHSLTRWLRRHQIKGLHAHHFSVYSDLQRPALAAGVGTTIVTEHTAQPVAHDRQYREITARLAPKATVVVAINETVRNAICDVSSLTPSSVEVIENGIDTEKFLPGPKTTSNDIRVIWLGRLHPDKDITAGLRAFEVALQTSSRPLQLHVVGDGQDRGKAQEFVRDRGLGDSVVFHGEVADPVALLQTGDIFLMSSQTEGTPLALLEALSCGLPAVATAVGGIPETVSSAVGFLSSAGDVDGLGKHLVRLAENSDMRADMANAARNLAVGRYSEKRMAQRYLNLLNGKSLEHSQTGQGNN